MWANLQNEYWTLLVDFSEVFDHIHDMTSQKNAFLDPTPPPLSTLHCDKIESFNFKDCILSVLHFIAKVLDTFPQPVIKGMFIEDPDKYHPLNCTNSKFYGLKR